jgi:hypothetical protein
MNTLGIDLLHEAAAVIFIADAEVFDQIPLFQLTCKVRSKESKIGTQSGKESS